MLQLVGHAPCPVVVVGHASAGHGRVVVEVHVHRLDAVPVLTDATHKADLLVMGSRGRGGFHGLALGSVTHKMLHFTGCPMVVTTAHTQSG